MYTNQKKCSYLVHKLYAPHFYRMVYLSVYIETYGESNFKHVMIKTRITPV